MSHKLFGSFRPKTKTINITLINGGVGDLVAALVPIDYMLRRYPWITPLIWIPDMMLDLAKNLLPAGTEVYSYSEMKGRYIPNRPTKTTQWDGHTSAMKIHCVDYAFLKMLDELPPISDRNYLRLKPGTDVEKFFLPKKFIVITTGFTSDVKEFLPEYINKVVDYAHAKEYAVVFLGSSNTKTGSYRPITAAFREEIAFGKGLNLVDKTTLLECAEIMSRAACVVGVDNGLLHVAGTTDVPIVGGFTFITPESKMPYRHDQLGWNFFPVVPDSSLACAGCQVTTNFLYGHDYRKCLWRGVDESKVNLCARQMRAEKFIQHLDQIL